MKRFTSYIYSIGAILLVGLVFSCSEEEPINMAPTFKLNSVTNIMRTSATFSGSISGEMSQIKEYGFQYSLSEDFTANLTNEVKVGDTPSSGTCEATIKGLEANERYYYRLYATTGASTVYSPSEYFQTIASSAPMLSALTVDSIGENMIRFTCTVEDIGDEYLLEYGVGYKKSSDKSYIPIASDSIVPVSVSGLANTFYVEIIDLEPATNYMFRPYAKNSADANGDSGAREGYGTVENIKTENQLSAVVTTNEIMEGNIGMNSFTVSGKIISAIGSNGVVDACGFCWSKTNSTPSIVDNVVEVSVPKLNEYFQATVSDLQTSTTYYVRAFARNTVNGEERIGYGEVQPVTTNDIITPQLSWVTYKNEWGDDQIFVETTPTSIRLKARIENYDESALIEKGFIWDRVNGQLSLEEARQKNTCLKVDLGTGDNIIDGTIEGLEINTGYVIRAYAIYQASGLEEIGYSDWAQSAWTQNFESPYMDNVEVNHNKITSSSVELVGKVTGLGNGTIIERGFCLSNISKNSESTNYDPTLTNCDMSVKSDETFISTVTGLESSTEYAVHSYMISKLGERVDTTYSGWRSTFWTKEIIKPSFKDIVTLSTTDNSITIASGILSLGEAEEIVEKGFCWKINKDGTWSDPTLNEGENDGYVVITEGTQEDFSCTINDVPFSSEYRVRVYTKVKVGANTVVVYSNTFTIQSRYRLDIYIGKESGNETSMTLKGYVHGLENMPSDLTVSEVGYFWDLNTYEWTELPAEQIITTTLDSNNEITGTLTDLSPNTMYYLGIYVKFSDGRYNVGYWYSAWTTTNPSIDDLNSPIKK